MLRKERRAMAVRRMSKVVITLMVTAISCFMILCSMCRVDAMVDPSPDEENAKTVAAASNSSSGNSGANTGSSKTKNSASSGSTSGNSESSNSGSSSGSSNNSSGSTNGGTNGNSGSNSSDYDDDEDVLDENAFSTPGNATLGDMVKSSGSKDFYTIRTDNDNTFYLVIDHSGNMDNVYMLSTIDENDLKDFLENGEEDSGSFVLPETKTQQDEESESEVQTPAPETQKSRIPGIISLIVLIGMAIGGGVLFMQYRRRGSEPEEYLSENMEDDGLPTVNEDEEFLE